MKHLPVVRRFSAGLAVFLIVGACGSDDASSCPGADALLGDYRFRLSNFRDCNGPVESGPLTQVAEIDPRPGGDDLPGCTTRADTFDGVTCLLRRVVECPPMNGEEGFETFLDIQFFEDGTIEGLSETTFTTGPSAFCTQIADLTGDRL